MSDLPPSINADFLKSVGPLLFPPAVGLNPYVLSSSIAGMNHLIQKTDPENSPDNSILDNLSHSTLFPPSSSKETQEKRPGINESLLGNFGQNSMNGQDILNLRLLLESVNKAVTRSLLEDNLLRWNGLFKPPQWDSADQSPSPNPAPTSRHNSYDSDGCSDDESPFSMNEPQEIIERSEMSVMEKKSRVRSIISEEQLTVLRSCYQINPMPRREELQQIADVIGHPYKVVKVWFQNSRARDRREGKLLPLPPPSSSPHVTASPAYHTLPAPPPLSKYPTPPPSIACLQQYFSPSTSPVPHHNTHLKMSSLWTLPPSI